MTVLLDVAPVAAGAGIAAGVGFLLVFLGIAFFAFRLLKRTVKMAVRMTIVAVIIAIAIAGSAYFFLSGSSKPPRPTPRPTPAR
jgi:hypothetical protein